MKPSELKIRLQQDLDSHISRLGDTPHNNGGRMLCSYDDFKSFYRKARNPKRGRRLASSYWIRSTNGQHVSKSYSVLVYDPSGFELCRIGADNVLEFVADPADVWRNSQSLVSSMNNWIPIIMYRHKKGLYRAMHSHKYNNVWKVERTHELERSMRRLAEDNLPEDVDLDYPDRAKYWQSGWGLYDKILKTAPAYFKGMKFDMTTLDCINPKLEPEWIERPEERKQWRRCLSKFKRRIKAMERVGALEHLKAEVKSNCQGKYYWEWKQPNWQSEEWLDLLYNSMLKSEYPKELMKGIVESRPNSSQYGTSVDEPIDTVANMEKIFKDLSVDLRRKFKVFDTEGYSFDHLKSWRSENHYDTIEEQTK